MRRMLTGVLSLSIVAGGAFVAPGLLASSGAADGTGAYGTWALSPDRVSGSVTFTGTLFPDASVTSTGQNLGVATSQVLNAATPFGAQYGPSNGRNYLTVGLAAGVNRANVTITFETPPVPGTYGLAMGDVDAENVILTATDAAGRPVDVREWNGVDFNYAGGTDLPRWDPATGTITGNGVDTAGASMWIVPSSEVRTITLTQTRTSGFPSYQLWIAADILTATPVTTPTASLAATAIPTAPAGKVTICHRTASERNPYVEMTIDQAAVTRRGHDTHDGGIFPARPWGDIIPPFPGYAGKNWPAGASILANNCETGREDLVADALESSGSASASASASASPSGSASASGTSSPTSSPTASPTSSPTSSPTASQTPSPTASVTATPALTCTVNETALVNGGFEEPVIPARSYRLIDDSLVPGWTTSATDKKIEIWSDGYNGVVAPAGRQFAELNATQDSELSQVVDTVPGQELVWSLYHRARGGGTIGDTMSVNIGPADGAPNSTTTFTDTLAEGWVRHTGTYVVPAGQVRTRFGFESGRTASGNRSIGNFLDNIVFTTRECLKQSDIVDPPVGPVPSTASPTASPTTSPTASPTTSPTASPTASPTGEPTALPEPDRTERPEAPVVVDPQGPTPIDVPGEVIGTTGDPSGTVEVRDGEVTYTPAPGFRGTETFTVLIEDRNGDIVAVPVTIRVGKPANPCATLPSSLTFGRNVLPAATGACQPVRVTVQCSPLARMLPLGDIARCSVTTSGGRTVVTVASGDPVAVRLQVTAEQRGQRPAVALEDVYGVRR